MSLDFSNLVKEMAAAAGEALHNQPANLGNVILSVLESNGRSIYELAVAYSQGDITESEFAIELQREKTILETEMFSMEIVSKAGVQKAMTAAIDTLKNTVNKTR